jgi:hypothetical protein
MELMREERRRRPPYPKAAWAVLEYLAEQHVDIPARCSRISWTPNSPAKTICGWRWISYYESLLRIYCGIED